MFFCRHQLLRAHAQRQFSTLLATRHVPHRVSVTHTPPPRHRYVRYSSSGPTPATTSETIPDKSSEPETSPVLADDSPASVLPATASPQHQAGVLKGGAANSSPIEEETLQDGHPQENSLEDTEEFKQNPCTAYMSYRQSKERAAISHIPRRALATITMDALDRKQRDVMDALVKDAVYMCSHGTGRKHENSHLATILLKHVAPRRFLSKKQILDLLRAMRACKYLHDLTKVAAVKISLAALAYEPNEELDGPLLEILKELLMEKLPPRENCSPMQTNGATWELTSSGTFAPIAVWPLFRLMLAFARRGEQSTASGIMAALLRGRRIDRRAIDATDLEAKDYVYVVLSVIVRSCINSGWFTRATTLLCPTVAARERVSLPLAQLVEDWLVAALKDSRDQDLAEAASMLIILMERADDYVVPNELLQRFYTEATKADKGELMQAVYRCSREIASHSYRPPRGFTLVWFVRYLRSTRRDVHLSRVLVKHIVDENVPVEPSVRGSFLYNAAAFGFTLQARALWERWSTGPERSYVVAMSATMLRLVSAFLSAEAATRRQAMRRPPSSALPDETRKNRGETAGEGEDGRTGTGTSREQEMGSRERAEGDHPASDAPHSPSPPPPHAHANGAAASCGTQALVREDPSREELLERAADIRVFAERVFDAFCAQRAPLECADRFALNALARGAFMLGRDREAFGVFEVMKARGLKLDMHDLNVVISVVAKADPGQGLARIERMVEAGLKPDAVTYGTVIHWAIFHGDGPLVGRVIATARGHGLGGFSFKTLAALVHATVQPEFAGVAGEGTQLENVESIVETMLDMGILPSPNVGRDCVKAALLAEDPVHAFRFWKELLKDKVEWGDAGQMRVRVRIARQIREHYSSGWLEEKRARVMLSELGYNLFSLYVRRGLAGSFVDGARLSSAAGG